MAEDGTALPFVFLAGSEEWTCGYEAGQELAARFPGQCADDFGQACWYNSWGPLRNGDGIIELKLIHAGWRDGDHWTWLALTGGGLWKVEAGCGYTGWEYSTATWSDLSAPPPPEPDPLVLSEKMLKLLRIYHAAGFLDRELLGLLASKGVRL